MIYRGNSIFEDNPSGGDGHRRSYVRGIEKYIQRKNEEARRVRDVAMASFYEDIENKRREYLDMLGLSVFSGESCPATERELVGSDDVSDIYRLKVYITPEIPMYAMLFLPRVSTPVPLVVAQHGGGGTPELCSDLVGLNNYNHMVRRLLDRGAAVIAPQLLLWSLTEEPRQRMHDIPYNRQMTGARLSRFGASITALEVTGIMRCIDYASALPEIDPERVGMIGLSYGGYFTLHTMAADTRIKAGYAAGVFNDRDKYDWTDWCYKGSAYAFQDAEVAALCAPRRLYISVGREDAVFDYRTAEPEGARAVAYYREAGAEDSIRFSVWDGGHTVEDSDDGYDFIFEALK